MTLTNEDDDKLIGWIAAIPVARDRTRREQTEPMFLHCRSTLFAEPLRANAVLLVTVSEDHPGVVRVEGMHPLDRVATLTAQQIRNLLDDNRTIWAARTGDYDIAILERLAEWTGWVHLDEFGLWELSPEAPSPLPSPDDLVLSPEVLA